MKRFHIPGIVDLFEVNDSDEIRALNNDPKVDRIFKTGACPVNWFLLKRALSVLSVHGVRFPTMTPRSVSARQLDQRNLWSMLDKRAQDMRAGVEELEPLALWVTGAGDEQTGCLLTQQLLGRIFDPRFVATEKSWAAAKLLVAAPHESNLVRLAWWFASGKVRRAKTLLASMVGGNLSGVNAIGIAVHNLLKGLRHMRAMYSNEALRKSLTASEAARKCLFAPKSLFRQATEAGSLKGCPYPRNALFVFNMADASLADDSRALVFMTDTWSQCPAASWTPALLEGVWKRAMAHTRSQKMGADVADTTMKWGKH